MLLRPYSRLQSERFPSKYKQNTHSFMEIPSIPLTQNKAQTRFGWPLTSALCSPDLGVWGVWLRAIWGYKTMIITKSKMPGKCKNNGPGLHSSKAQLTSWSVTTYVYSGAVTHADVAQLAAPLHKFVYGLRFVTGLQEHRRKHS